MRRTLVTLVALGVGATLLVWQVQQLGLDRITSGLRAVGWGFLGILLLSLLRFAARSLAWTTLIGQGLSGFDAAVLGAWVHGRAGDHAAEAVGPTALCAVDVLTHLPAALREAERNSWR